MHNIIVFSASTSEMC